MIRHYAVVREAAARVGAAAEGAVNALQDGRIEQEPAFTDRMLGAIEETMRTFESKGVVWHAKTLTDRGLNAQEKVYGADFAGVLSIDLPDFKVKKGFVAQAKLLEREEKLSSREFERLRHQCDLMLELTPDSFVFLYSKRGVVVVPAVSVVSSGRRNPHEYYGRSISRFYEEHFESFIGDTRLQAADASVLKQLRAAFRIRSMLYLEARSG